LKHLKRVKYLHIQQSRFRRSPSDLVVTRVRFVEPARLEILAEVGYYHRVEAGLGAKFLDAA
jgi:hypothetical protein